MSANQQVLVGLGGEREVIGQQAYTTPGTYSWVCPAGVTSVSVVCVGPGGYNVGGSPGQGGGGGGLGYLNNYSVTPGNTYTVVVGGFATDTDTNFNSGVCVGMYGKSRYSGGYGGGYTGTGGGEGGDGGYNSASQVGGGGAGGYSGKGGRGGGDNPTSGQSGSGGAGGGGGNGGHRGGGVGILGIGDSGGTSTGVGLPGSGGLGGNYGAGGSWSADGGGGACRIIWPGNKRQFPATRTADE